MVSVKIRAMARVSVRLRIKVTQKVSHVFVA